MKHHKKQSIWSLKKECKMICCRQPHWIFVVECHKWNPTEIIPTKNTELELALK